MADVNTALADVFREEAGRLTSALVHILGDFAVAEEIVQDALLVALERWPVDGIPDRPGAWLLTVARRRALNQLSRDARYRAGADRADLAGGLRLYHCRDRERLPGLGNSGSPAHRAGAT